MSINVSAPVDPVQYEIREFRQNTPFTGRALFAIIEDNNLKGYEFWQFATEQPAYDPQRFTSTGVTYIVRFRKRTT